MKPRVISFLRHPYTTRQALASMLDMWTDDRMAPILLLTQPEEAEKTARNIRVILAKERGKYEPAKRVHYGFTQSEPFPYTESRVKGEAVILRWRITPVQNLRNSLRGIEMPVL